MIRAHRGAIGVFRRDANISELASEQPDAVSMASREDPPAQSVVVVGSYNTDLVIWCDSIPTKGQSLMGDEFEMFCGGRGANCAVAAARAGCLVKFVGAHGPDPFGRMARERLAHEHIDISHFIELPSSKTGVALVFQERSPNGHAALIATSANNQFPASLVTKAEPMIREADLIFTQFEIGSPPLFETFRLCSRHHRRLVVHASPVGSSTHLPAASYYLLVQDDFESLALTGESDLFAATRELHRRGVKNLILKHRNDSLTFSDGMSCRTQSIPHAQFVQSAGTAECLTAWAGITLAMTSDLPHAAQVAAEAMAFSLSRHGAQDSMPYPSELPISWPVAALRDSRSDVPTKS
jgi:ribokinase